MCSQKKLTKGIFRKPRTLKKQKVLKPRKMKDAFETLENESAEY